MNQFPRITINPKVCLGEPTIRGMRITVSIILKQVAAGMSHDEIIGAYPELEKDDITETLKFAAWLASEKVRSLPLTEPINV
ncbi:MAG: DUF433 domain-containing protein [Bacteroidetes bacterium]|nr:MAG: DUF433 domain-containing protein [Bacteroidota bacterium]